MNQGHYKMTPLSVSRWYVWLKIYLDYRVGVSMDNDELVHLLWDDVFIMFSNPATGLHSQLNDLYYICVNNRMVVNEAKSKAMWFDMQAQFGINSNDEEFEQGLRYK